MKFSSPFPSPLPTAAPSAALLQQKLALRQEVGDICGYVNQDFSDSMYCNPGYTCAYNSIHSIQGCCSNINSCDLITACIDYTAIPANCNAVCESDDYILKCPSSEPYCFSATFPVAELSGFGCGTIPNFVESVYPTYSGEFTSAAQPTISLAPILGTATSSMAPGTENNNNLATQTSAAPTSSSTDSTSGGDSSLSVGAIAGIAVGGAGVLILGALLAWLIICQKRRRERRRGMYVPPPMPPPDHYPSPQPGNDYIYAKEAQFGGISQVSSPGLTPGLSPGMPSPGAPGSMGGMATQHTNERLSRTNLDALERERMNYGMNRDSTDLARGRRLSEDGTAIPERSVAGVTNFTRITEDSMRLR